MNAKTEMDQKPATAEQGSMERYTKEHRIRAVGAADRLRGEEKDLQENGWVLGKRGWGDVRIMGVEETNDGGVRVEMLSENAFGGGRHVQEYALEDNWGRPGTADALERTSIKEHRLPLGRLVELVRDAKVGDPRESEDWTRLLATMEKFKRTVSTPSSFVERAKKLVGRKVAVFISTLRDDAGNEKRCIQETRAAGFGQVRSGEVEGGIGRKETRAKAKLQVESVHRVEDSDGKQRLALQGRVWRERFGTGEKAGGGKGQMNGISPENMAKILLACKGGMNGGEDERKDVTSKLAQGKMDEVTVRRVGNLLKGVRLEHVVIIPKEGIQWQHPREWLEDKGKHIPQPTTTVHCLNGKWVQEPQQEQSRVMQQTAGDVGNRGGGEPDLPQIGGCRREPVGPAPEAVQAPGMVR